MVNHVSFDTITMKKVLILLTTILFALQMQAQDAMLLNRIREANSKVKSFESDLANTMVKPKKTTSQNGKLYFVSPYEFSAQFNTGNYMIVNSQKIKMDIGMFHGTFKLKDGGMMQGLSRIFLYGFQGRIQDLANENGYTISTNTEGGYHIVTGTAKKKPIFGVGYKTVVFKYHTDNLMLKEIVLFDYSGNKDSYVISNVKYDVAVDKKKFQF